MFSIKRKGNYSPLRWYNFGWCNITCHCLNRAYTEEDSTNYDQLQLNLAIYMYFTQL